jgi:hypothetical protein
VERLERGELTVSEVAASLGKSRRQVQRIRKRVSSEGQVAVVHGNTGRAPMNKTTAKLEAWILELRRGRYKGFNDEHFTAKLVEEDKKFPLDATGEFLTGAHFTEREGTVGYLKLLRGMMVSKGIPQTVYSDRHGSLTGASKRSSPASANRRALYQDPWRSQQGSREKPHRTQQAIHGRAPGREPSMAKSTVGPHSDSRPLLAALRSQGSQEPHGSGGRPRHRRVPKRKDAVHATYSAKRVIVKHLRNGHIRVFHDGECIAWHEDGPRPKETKGGPQTLKAWKTQERRREAKRTEQPDDE